MKHGHLNSIVVAVAAMAVTGCGVQHSMQDRLTKNDRKINKIIAGMTLEEKVEMMHSKTIMSSEGIPRLGIQEIRYADGPFGIREELGDGFRALGWKLDSATYFPTGSALAATWSEDMAYEYGTGMSREARLRGKDVILGPAVNIQRLPVGGRTYEYFSEDPFLSSRLAVGYTEGAQDAGTAVCVKHFAVNNQETNRGTVNAIIDERTMREIYLKPFEAAVREAGAMSIMTAYNKVNGTYCAENPKLNNEILRGEWGFKGFTVSDWGGTHSTMGSAFGGLDVQMTGNEYFGPALIDSVRAGKVPESVIDDKIRELLRVRFAIEAVPEDVANTVITSQPEQQQIAYRVATKSVVLLKNEEGVLPINTDKVKTIAVIGLNAVAKTASGGMGADVKALYEITPLQGLQEKLGDKVEIVYAQGYKNYAGMFGRYMPNRNGVASKIDEAPDPVMLVEAIEAAKHSDMVLFFAGTNKSIETEGSDRENIMLPVGQDILAAALAEANPNMVTVIISGGPCDLNVINECSKAVVQGWWNGSEGGRALADILSGNISPSGKLPFTFPMKLEDSPAYAMGNFPQNQSSGDIFGTRYREDIEGQERHVQVDSPEAHYTEGQLVGYRWFDTKNVKVMYPFGHGLSYSSFAYADMKTDRESYKAGNTIKVDFSLTNNGSMDADEVAQLYVHRIDSSIEWPVKELKAFGRIALKAGETKRVTLEIPVSDLRYWNVASNGWELEKGRIELLLGSSSSDIRARAETVIE